MKLVFFHSNTTKCTQKWASYVLYYFLPKCTSYFLKETIAKVSTDNSKIFFKSIALRLYTYLIWILYLYFSCHVLKLVNFQLRHINSFANVIILTWVYSFSIPTMFYFFLQLLLTSYGDEYMYFYLWKLI